MSYRAKVVAAFSTVAWIIAATCLFPSSAEAQDAGTVPAAQPTTKPVDEDPDSIRPGGSTAMSLIRQQNTIQAMELARNSIGRKDYLAAIPLLERILSAPESFVPFDATTEVGTHEEVRRLMDQLPSDLKQRLNEPRRAAAKVAWEQVRLKDQTDVVTFLQRYGDLPQGIDAWWWIACRERDRSRHHLAGTAFARVSNHPAANGKQILMAMMAEFESAIEAGLSERQHLLRERLNQFSRTTEVVIEGQPVTLGNWLNANRESPGTSTPGSASADDPRSRIPVPPPVWQTSFPRALRKEFEASEQKWRDRQREQGVRPFSILRPTIAANLAIIRTLDAIRACDIASGDLRWSIPNVEYQEIDRNWSETNVFLTNAIEWALRRTSADSIFGRVSTDAHHLFAIQEPDRLGEFRINRSAGPQNQIHSGPGPGFNKLCCYLMESGQLAWEIGGKNSDNLFDGQVFLSAPLIVDDVAYVVAQRDLRLSLFAIDANQGTLRWSIELGTVTLAIADDRQRSRVACAVIWHEGQLFCSTSAGVVIAVDPILRSSRWAYRYPATTVAMGELHRGPNLDDINNRFEPWWDRWREPFMQIADVNVISVKPNGPNAPKSPTLIFASPETDQLHAIRIGDGQPLWRIPREGGIIVAGIVDQVLVVVEADSIRGVDIATGEQRWRTQTTEIGGPGSLDESILVLPAANGGPILIDVRTGQLVSPAGPNGPSFSSLARTESGWIAHERGSLARYPALSEVRRIVEQDLRSAPENETLKIRAARLDLWAGNAIAALKRLDGLDSTDAREARRQAMIDVLASSTAKLPAIDRSALAQQLKELSSSNEQKFAACVAIAQSTMTDGDFVNAVDVALDGLTLDLDLSETFVKETEVNVRPDRLLLGLIERALSQASPEQMAAIDKLFASRVQDARKSRDRFAVQELARQWQGLDAGRQVVVRESEKVFRRKPFCEIEIRLLDAAGSNDRQLAMQALDSLAAKLENSNAAVDAQAIRREILRQRRSIDPAARRESPSDKSIAQAIWPQGEPVQKEIDKTQSDTRGVYTLIPLHAEPGSLAERMDLYLERNGTEILFRNESLLTGRQDFGDESRLKLPPSVSPFRGSIGYMLREAWGIGRSFILLVGGDLFAVSPLDENGKFNPRFLWSQPVDIQGSPRDTRVVVAKSKNNEGRHLIIDQLNRPIGRIGPVRPNYLCFQRGSKLVAIETETGRTLWERLNLPADVTALGDDHFVYLWHESRLRERLSALDGRKVDERKLSASPSMMFHQRDSLVWTISQRERFHLDALDLRTASVVWSRAEPRETRAAVLDIETLAVVTPDGRLHIISADTGQNLCEPLPVDAKPISGLATWHDQERWYVALMQPPVNGNSWKSQRPSDTYRRILVNGTLMAIDRHQPRIVWQNAVTDEPIPLDQPAAAPVLMQAWRVPAVDESALSDCVVRVLDKRTGHIVLERRGPRIFPNYLLNPKLENGILEVQLPSETVELSYTPSTSK